MHLDSPPLTLSLASPSSLPPIAHSFTPAPPLWSAARSHPRRRPSPCSASAPRSAAVLAEPCQIVRFTWCGADDRWRRLQWKEGLRRGEWSGQPHAATRSGRAVRHHAAQGKAKLTSTTELPISSYSAFPIHSCTRETSRSKQIVSSSCGAGRAAWASDRGAKPWPDRGARLTWWNVPSEAITDPPSHDECSRSAGDDAASAGVGVDEKLVEMFREMTSVCDDCATYGF